MCDIMNFIDLSFNLSCLFLSQYQHKYLQCSKKSNLVLFRPFAKINKFTIIMEDSISFSSTILNEKVISHLVTRNVNLPFAFFSFLMRIDKMFEAKQYTRFTTRLFH